MRCGVLRLQQFIFLSSYFIFRLRTHLSMKAMVPFTEQKHCRTKWANETNESKVLLLLTQFRCLEFDEHWSRMLLTKKNTVLLKLFKSLPLSYGKTNSLRLWIRKSKNWHVHMTWFVHLYVYITFSLRGTDVFCMTLSLQMHDLSHLLTLSHSQGYSLTPSFLWTHQWCNQSLSEESLSCTFTYEFNRSSQFLQTKDSVFWINC